MKSTGSTPEHALWSAPSEGGEYQSRALEIITRANDAAEEAFPWNYSNARRSRLIEKELMKPAGIRSWEEFAQELYALESRWREGRGKLASLLPTVDKRKIKRIAVCPLPKAADSPRKVLTGEGIDHFFGNLCLIRDYCPPPMIERESPLPLGFLACWHPDIFLDDKGQIVRAMVVGWLVDADILARQTKFDLLLAEVTRCYPDHKNRVIEAWRQIDPAMQDPVWRLMHEPNPTQLLAAEACNLVQQLQVTKPKKPWPDTQKNILQALDGQFFNGPQLEKAVNLSKRGLQDALRPLQEAGLVKNIRGKGKGYYRTDAPPAALPPSSAAS